MTVQAIRPAGAGHETAAVLAACAVIVLLATLTIVLRTTSAPVSQIQAGQVDARHGLTAAEQGVYADLLVAAQEIGLAQTPPQVSDLAEQMIPPFVTDASTERRGGHDWQMKQDGQMVAYIGVTHAPDTAGSMLLRMTPPTDATAHADQQDSTVQVWLQKDTGRPAHLPTALTADSLAQEGWQQVVSQFDAGATRHQH
ncbi:DUF6162 family protein [Advenella mimigardefordensis]|uniref:Transmembrane protein n=1 Tax=Advenella mimigardefordensis (strain DSM 17166 / LMG 22922 / DPN7) TaxID=1247726 RepID=W0PCM3_ADVMD|nr:DUF6162 family protein [Advenella mimigardefordensis]AHG64644.1 hypothetical protein MIM_c25740 [Advenella mimigardefordensis DPN7]